MPFLPHQLHPSRVSCRGVGVLSRQGFPEAPAVYPKLTGQGQLLLVTNQQKEQGDLREEVTWAFVLSWLILELSDLIRDPWVKKKLFLSPSRASNLGLKSEFL